jgi:hypothetical protein
LLVNGSVHKQRARQPHKPNTTHTLTVLLPQD